MGNTFFFDWEVNLMVWIQAHLGSFGDKIATFLTYFGEELVLVGLLIFVYFAINKKNGRKMLISAIFTMLCGCVVKDISARRRPYMDHSSVECLRPVKSGADIQNIKVQGYSFPSLHALNSLSVFGSIAVYFEKKKFWIVTIIISLLVGWSRVALGVHYPTDVIAGWLVSALALLIVNKLINSLKDERILYLIMFAACIPGWFFIVSDGFYTVCGLMVASFCSFMIDDHFIHFEDPENVFHGICRVVIALILFVVICEGGKMLIPEAIRDNGSFADHILRCTRYAVAGLISVGLLPMSFKKVKFLR